ncbi:hypothetical protein HC766_09115 [Candidatus Gracilibacteria bacterium]|nr:hypothetical protein [Candidatus Gracilibacteria bacterium]
MLLPSAFGYNSDAAENEIDQTSIESDRAKTIICHRLALSYKCNEFDRAIKNLECGNSNNRVNLPSFFWQLTTACCQLSTVNCQLSTVNYVLSGTAARTLLPSSTSPNPKKSPSQQ